MNVLILGGGGIAQGIRKVVGGTILEKSECDIRYETDLQFQFDKYAPSVVVNCAGVSYPAPIKDMKNKHFTEELETNLLGSFMISKVAAQYGCDTMIFIASVAGMYGKPNHAGYSASKAGVISLVESLGMEGYDAYAISPGRVDTKLRQKDYPNEDPRTRLSPEKIGEIVQDILNGEHKPGDNIIIRMQGHKILPIEVDQNVYWKETLKIGLPPQC